jgi:hypothetical protein
MKKNKHLLASYLLSCILLFSFISTANASYIWVWNRPTLINSANEKYIKSPYFPDNLPKVGEVVDLRNYIPTRKFRTANTKEKEIETIFYNNLETITKIANHYNKLYNSKSLRKEGKCDFIFVAGSLRYYMGELRYIDDENKYCTVRHLNLKKNKDYIPASSYKVKVLSYMKLKGMTFMQIEPVKNINNKFKYN